MKKGIVVLGHGSRLEAANEEFRAICGLLAATDRDSVYAPAFLSMSEPGLITTAKQMYEDGIREIIVLPVFVTTGSHVARDIPEIIEVLKSSCTGLKIVMAEHLGADSGLVELLHRKIELAGAALQECEEER